MLPDRNTLWMRVACDVLLRFPNESQIAGQKKPEDKERLMGSPAQSRSRAAQSMFSPLSVTREREKTEEGEAQKEAPERPKNLIFSLLNIKEDRERKERARASQRSPERQRREMPRRKLRRGPRV